MDKEIQLINHQTPILLTSSKI